MSAICIDPTIFTSKRALEDKLNSTEGIVLVKHYPNNISRQHSSTISVGFKDVATNDPKRTKFATIERKATGWKVS